MGFGGFGGFGEEAAAPNPTQQFTTILREGPDLGIHSLVWCDTMTSGSLGATVAIMDGLW
jgi:hypothetical protein